jgi:hypothetical protein
MSGAIPPLTQYAFIAWCSVKSTGTTLPLPLRTYYRRENILFAQPVRIAPNIYVRAQVLN